MKPPERRSVWLPAALVAGFVAALTGLSATLLADAGLKRSMPSLEQAGEAGAKAVGQAIAGQFARALELGIPLERLPGVEPYLARVVAESPQVHGLAVLDAAGGRLYATAEHVDGLRFPIAAGAGKATLVVAPESLLVSEAVTDLRMALAIAAVLAGLVAGAVVAGYLAFERVPARRGLADTLARMSSGDFNAAAGDGRGRLGEAGRALAACLEKVEAARRRLVAAAATVLAIDFDGSLAQRVDAIVRPLEMRYPLSTAATEPRTHGEAASRVWAALWRAAVIAGLYAAAFPLVANFAMDREPETLPRAWWPILPLLAETAAAVVGAWFGRGRGGRARALLLLGAVVLGGSLAATYWCRTYETFVVLRAAAGLAGGFVLTGLLTGSGIDPRRAGRFAAFIFSALIAGPLFAGLCTEAVGRRGAFLILGAVVLIMAPFIASGPESRPDASSGRHPAAPDLLFAIGVIPAAAMLLVTVPAGLGYDNYLAASGVFALFGLFALIAPALPPLARGLALLIAALSQLVAPDAAWGLLAACAAIGLAAGGMIKASARPISAQLPMLALGIVVALLAAGVMRAVQLPFAYVLAAVALVVAAGRAAPARPPLRPE